MYKVSDLYDLNATIAKELFDKKVYPWEALPNIGDFIKKLGFILSKEDFECRKGNIWIHKSVSIADTATIMGPLIIDKDTTVRPGAFIRGNAIIGKNCVVGNSTEIKNSILFDVVQVPHYNYVGDSILGTHSHMGAGAITSNVKADKTPVVVKNKNESVETGLKKFGAMIGDYVEVGCNCVLNPGTVIGKNTNIYPLSSVRGVVPQNSILKDGGIIADKK